MKPRLTWEDDQWRCFSEGVMFRISGLGDTPVAAYMMWQKAYRKAREGRVKRLSTIVPLRIAGVQAHR